MLTENKETGGSAFPIFPETGGGHAAAFHGMTLRDYFAANAIQGHLQNGGWGCDDAHFDALAEGAYRLADAFLKARK
jgi:hypothetical protein